MKTVFASVVLCAAILALGGAAGKAFAAEKDCVPNTARPSKNPGAAAPAPPSGVRLAMPEHKFTAGPHGNLNSPCTEPNAQLIDESSGRAEMFRKKEEE